MVDADPGALFDVALDLGPSRTGLVGTLGIRIVDPGVQETTLPRTTAGIVEFPVGSGVYGARLVAPLAPGLYMIVWDLGILPLTDTNSFGEPLTILIENPTFPGGWSWTPYGWLSGDAQFNVSTGAPGSNPIPTAATVRATSKLDWDEYGYGDDAGPGGLQEIVDQAESAFWRITGQTLDRIDVKDAPLVRRVITGLTQQIAQQSGEDYLDTLEDFDLIASFAAGPYCVPMDTEALTPDGWRTYGDLRIGEHLLGFDPETQTCAWTPIEGFVAPFNADVVRFGNKLWSLRCTPNHRWLSWCDGKDGATRTVATSELAGSWAEHPIFAVEADYESTLSVTPVEAALISWLHTDGGVTRIVDRPAALAQPRLIDGWTTCAACGERLKYGGRGMPRRFCSGCRLARRKETGKAAIRGFIYQSHYPEIVEATLAVAGAPYTTQPRVSKLSDKVGLRYEVQAGWLRDLWERAQLDELTLSQFVLRLDREARDGFLSAAMWADGHQQNADLDTRRTDFGPWYGWHFAQNRGPVLDAVVLAAHLSGYPARPWNTKAACSGFRCGRPDQRGYNMTMTPAGREMVWCPTTRWGTWTMRQGDLIALTGNSESRRSPGDMFKARMLNSVPWISDALWNLLSYDKYGFWMSFFSGINQPAWQTSDVFWEEGQIAARLYGPDGFPGGFWGA